MTNRLAIAKCLKSKNNLSALGLDGIGYLFLKLGEIPQVDFIRKTSKMEAAMHFRVYQVFRRTGVVRYRLSVSAPRKEVRNIDAFLGGF
jgi:hypothetical protein